MSLLLLDQLSRPVSEVADQAIDVRDKGRNEFENVDHEKESKKKTNDLGCHLLSLFESLLSFVVKTQKGASLTKDIFLDQTRDSVTWRSALREKGCAKER